MGTNLQKVSVYEDGTWVERDAVVTTPDNKVLVTLIGALIAEVTIAVIVHPNAIAAVPDRAPLSQSAKD